MKIQPAILLLPLLLSFPCCTFTGRVPDRFPDAEETLSQQETLNIISSLKTMNSGLNTFKGIGGIKLSGINGTNTARMAWCGSVPDKLRASGKMSVIFLYTFMTLIRILMKRPLNNMRTERYLT